MRQSKSRKSLTLRLQPYEGTILAEVVDYLNSLDSTEANQNVIHSLIMTLLPLARYHQGNCSPEQLRLTCLEACDALSKHASYLRQVLQVSQPQFESVYLVLGNSVGSAQTIREVNANESQTKLPSSPSQQKEKTPDNATEEIKVEIDEIFGDGSC